MSDKLAAIHNVEQLEELLSEPTAGAVQSLAAIDGDLLLLGVGGKMGPTLARMARRAMDAAGVKRRVIGVSRFSDAGLQSRLQSWNVETIRGDLLDSAFVDALPDAAGVVFMTGRKFGSTGDEPLTWAMNVWLPTLVCRRFAASRIAAFSTGNVYPLVDVASGGSVETDALLPVGEYGMSGLGRERMFEHFSRSQGTPVSIIRLNYACELRYGVLVDIAARVFAGEAVDLSIPYVNVIWQADANAMALCSLADSATPAHIINVAGPEKLRIREVAETFAARFGKPIRFTGEEGSAALLNDSTLAMKKYGPPRVTADQLINAIADWIASGGEMLGKPTHFEVTDGRF